MEPPVPQVNRAFARPVRPAGGLRLRPPAMRDVAAIRAAYADPDVIRWFGVPPGFDARRYVEVEAPRDRRDGTEAVFVIADAADDAYLGGVDLRLVGGDAGEVGFLVVPAARGRGVATTALRMITRWGFDAVGLRSIQWRTGIGNHASRRVAEKAGFRIRADGGDWVGRRWHTDDERAAAG